MCVLQLHLLELKSNFLKTLAETEPDLQLHLLELKYGNAVVMPVEVAPSIAPTGIEIQ